MFYRVAVRCGTNGRRDLGRFVARSCPDEHVIGVWRCSPRKLTANSDRSARSLIRLAIGGVCALRWNGLSGGMSITTDHDSSVSKAALSDVRREAEIHGVAGHGISDNK